MISAIAKPAASIPVFHAADLPCVNGANEGDDLTFAEELMLDDTYWCAEDARQVRLGIEASDNGDITIGHDSSAGTPGAGLHLDRQELLGRVAALPEPIYGACVQLGPVLRREVRSSVKQVRTSSSKIILEHHGRSMVVLFATMFQF